MFRFLLSTLTPVIICLVLLIGAGVHLLVYVLAATLGIAAAILLGFLQYRRDSKAVDTFSKQLREIERSLENGIPANIQEQPSVVPVMEGLRKQTNALSVVTSNRISALTTQNRELMQVKKRFEGILGTMIEGVLVLDGNGQILYSNEAARKLLDSQSRDVDGRLFWEVVRTPELQEAIDSAIAIDQPFRKEYTLKRTKSVIEVSASRLLLKPDPGLVVVLHNVTELRRLEHMRRDFVSNVSHELKTPLTSIQAYADTLLEGALDDTENSRPFVTRILEQADRLQNLIQDMLRLARIESQSDAFECKPVPVGKTIIECVDARVSLAHARKISLRVETGDESLQTYADPEGLRTIIENLVTNALNHTREGGHVDLRWKHLNEKVIIEVQDNGVGIPKEHQARIFERFYRVDAARSRGMGGTGLGLSIVKHLTSHFGGSIEVESEVGIGTLFRVKLPLVKEPQASEQAV